MLVTGPDAPGGPGDEIESRARAAGFRRLSRISVTEVSPGRRISVPGVDLVVGAAAGDLATTLIDACLVSRPRFLVLLNGPEGDLDADRHRALVPSITRASRAGVSVIGPNSQGIISIPNRVFVGTGSIFASVDLRSGPVAVVTQSGFGHALVGLAEGAGIGFSHVISTGNQADLDVPALAAGLLRLPDVGVLWLLVEGIRNGRDLVDLGRLAARRGVPVLVWKAGDTPAGRQAAVAHTGAVVSDRALYEAAFEEGGLLSVHGEDALIDATRALLGRWPRARLARPAASKSVRPRRDSRLNRSQRAGADRVPPLSRVGIATVSGGAGVALADCCVESGLTISALDAQTGERLAKVVGPTRPIRNPLDMTRWIARSPDRYAEVLRILAADPQVDQLIVCNGGIEGDDAVRLATVLTAVADAADLPIAVAWTPRPGRATRALEMLEEAGIPSFTSLHRLAHAVAILPRAVSSRPAPRHPRRQGVGRLLAPELAGQVITERRAVEIAANAGIPVPVSRVLPLEPSWSATDLAGIRFPVVAKASGSELAHRARLGLVRTGVETPRQLRSAARALRRAARRQGIELDGLIVQEMASGIEVLVGAVVDPVFGPAVAVGFGGVDVEAMEPPAVGLAPLDRRAARSLVDRSSVGPFLSVQARAALARVVRRLSWFVYEHADVLEHVDLNPVVVGGTRALAVDVLMVARRQPPV